MVISYFFHNFSLSPWEIELAVLTQEVYYTYLHHLLNGERKACTTIVNNLTASSFPIDQIYVQLFQRSLYEVGELWEKNRISVATEHLATALTEMLMIRLQQQLFAIARNGRKAVIASVANEYHQVGAKMVADIFEWQGWDAYYLGANTPPDELIRFLDKHRPDLLGLSLSLYFNMPLLKNTIRQIRDPFPKLPIIAGGQAFRWGGKEIIQEFERVQLIGNIMDLQNFLKNYLKNGNQQL